MEHTLLLVEDEPAHAELVRRALKRLQVEVDLHVVSDGQSAVDYVKRRGAFTSENAPRPQVILLDLNLPKLSGFDVLNQLKSDPDLVKIPIVVLSSSANEGDVEHAYREHANGYLVKAIRFDALVEEIERFWRFWMDANRLPGAS
jgi:CheY-like chemotaxis protein